MDASPDDDPRQDPPPSEEEPSSLVQALAEAEPPAGPEDGDTPIRFFLIADVRGYPRFTQALGDEQAARLAARFAGVTREVVIGHNGVLLELRGDEALVVFTSPRRALRAAVELQARFLDETLDDPALPLGVGIGLDGGEAVEVEGGYRGGALNLAARLCSVAAAGEVLATQELVHMARAMDGVRYVTRGPRTFKGITTPATVVEVLPEVRDPAKALAFAQALRAGEPAPPAKDRRRVLAAGLVALALLVSAGVYVLRDRGAEVALVADSVAVVDLGNHRVQRAVPVGRSPAGLAYGYKAGWSANEAAGTLSRINPRIGAVVQTITVGRSPRGVSSGPTGVWVTNGDDRSVSWVNPEVNTVVKTVPVGNSPAGIVATADTVWVANRLDDTVSALSATTGEPLATIAVGGRPTGVAVGAGSVWVANSASATVSRIDPERHVVTDTINVGNGAGAVAVGAGGAWVTNTLDGTVSRIDPDSNRISATIQTGEDPGGITVDRGSVWVASQYGGTLKRIDPKRNAVATTIRLDARPREVVPVDGTLWVSTAGSPQAHRGGTLRLLTPEGYVPTIDPAIAYDYVEWGALSATNDGLVAFRRVGGGDGSTLVPDLATSLPKATDGGRTYRFQLRRGLHYSTGEPVRAADFRRTAERQLVLGPVGAYYDAIVGAEACLATPRTCSLESGVVTDEKAGTVTFRLSRPDGDFLAKLAMPWMYVVPASTPLRDIGTHPVPATGPYQISDFTPHRHVVLTRNPRFTEWSHAAQPDGYPDRIVIGLVDDDNQASLAQVQRGQADWSGQIDPEQLPELTTRFPTGLHLNPSGFSMHLLLNTRIPPFDDVRARRAVAYAVDRAALADVYGGPQQATPSCQLLPPTFPAYKPFCDYTVRPGPDARWHGTDLAKALQLVAASGTKGMRVQVTSGQDEAAAYVVRLMRSLGYRASLFEGDPNSGYEELVAGTSPINVAAGGWAADFPTPSGFLEALQSCHGPGNATGLCDPSLDATMERAKQLQATDGAAAAVAWQTAERRVVSLAALVPTVTTLTTSFTGARVGNVAHHPVFGPLFDQMWVRPGADPGADATLRPDPASLRVAARIPFGPAPTGAPTGDVWLPVRERGQLWRIERDTNRVTAKVKLGPDPERRVTAFGSVWVADPEQGIVTRVDATSGRVVQRIPTGRSSFGIAATSSAVWVAVSDQGALLKLEPRSGRVIGTVRYGRPLPDTVANVVSDEHEVWVQDDGALVRVDATSGRVMSTLTLPGPKGRADGDLALGAGSVWVTNTVDGVITRVDVASNSVRARIPVLPAPIGIAFAAGAVWVTSFNSGDVVVSKIDPASTHRLADVEVGSGSDYLWLDGGSLWTVARLDERIDRIDP
jgi:YVTN family beta-propeller protein